MLDPLLEIFWKRLATLKHVHMQTESGLEGFGEVTVTPQNEALLFSEKGKWVYPPTQAIGFSNALRWTFDRFSQRIALEHLRYGPNHPVFLFHLAPSGPNSLASIDSHVCANDCYSARIESHNQRILLIWRIQGPHKNEVLYYTYY